MTLSRTLRAVTISFACLLLAAPIAKADDDDTKPRARKKLRIRVKRVDVEDESEARRSPMTTIRKWMHERLQRERTAEDGMLAQWFDGGDDVPMADLRNALKADGWNAKSLGRWMREQTDAMAPVLHGLLGGAGRRHLFPQAGPRRAGARLPWGHGPSHGGACPHCGRGAGSPPERGSNMHALHSLLRSLLEAHGHGPHDLPRSWSRGARGGHVQPHGTVQRGWVIWHDGSGWQRAPLGPAMPQGTWTPPMHGLPGAPGMPGLRDGDREAHQLLEMLRGLLGAGDPQRQPAPRGPRPDPRRFGMPGHPGAQRMGEAQALLHAVREMLEQGGAEQLLEMLRAYGIREGADARKDAPTDEADEEGARKVRVRIRRPKEKAVEVIEDVVIEETEDK